MCRSCPHPTSDRNSGEPYSGDPHTNVLSNRQDVRPVAQPNECGADKYARSDREGPRVKKTGAQH